jgi:glucuronate isomerase
VEDLRWAEHEPGETNRILLSALNGDALREGDTDKFRSAFLRDLAEIYHKHDIAMQLHIGTYNDANTAMSDRLGPSTGFDCIDDTMRVKSVGRLLDSLTAAGALPRTILYPLNANLVEPLAVLSSAFCSGGIKARVQLGAPWWFNDQAFGIRRQFEAAAPLYPLSLSVGMLTDSRSFISYPRHELYRRVLCDYLGEQMEQGAYFADEETVGELIRDICHDNAKEFFGL